MLSVDMPLIKTLTLRRVLHLAGDADIAVIRSADGRVHPLCGLYSKSCRRAIGELIQSGKLRVDNLFSNSRLKVTFLDACDLGCDPMELANINTPEDLSFIRKFLSRPDW
jgi:molybdopterin-guanine dinucleotide biosynthesis protein A